MGMLCHKKTTSLSAICTLELQGYVYSFGWYTRAMKELKETHNIETAIILSNGVSLLLFMFRIVGAGNIDYWFMFWNLILAWIPVGVSWYLVKYLNQKSWREPTAVGLTLVWLAFLPNSFYMISDLVHLQQTGDIGILFDVVLFMSFIWNGLLAGFISLILVHRALIKRVSMLRAHSLIATILLANSFAIYLGRSLRWNSWDVLTNPGGLLFDVSERVINPFTYPQALVTTSTFFLLLGSMYLVIWLFAQTIPVPVKKQRRNSSFT